MPKAIASKSQRCESSGSKSSADANTAGKTAAPYSIARTTKAKSRCSAPSSSSDAVKPPTQTEPKTHENDSPTTGGSARQKKASEPSQPKNVIVQTIPSYRLSTLEAEERFRKAKHMLNSMKGVDVFECQRFLCANSPKTSKGRMIDRCLDIMGDELRGGKSLEEELDWIQMVYDGDW